MSASTEKKNRKVAREAGTDKKTIAAQEQAKEQAKSKRNWTIGIILVVFFIALTLFLNSGFLFKNTAALRVNGEKVSPAEVNYYYGQQNLMYQQYSEYYGYDFTSMYTKEEQLESVEESIRQVKAYCSYANENGVTLTADEIAEIDESLASLEEQVVAGGYKNLDTYYTFNYGTGVTAKLVRSLMLEQTLAQKAYEAAQDSLTYTDEELEEYFTALNGEGESYAYDYYYLAAETVESEPDADGNTTSAATEETIAEAKATADAIVAAYTGVEGETPAEKFAAAVADITGAEPYSTSNIQGSSLNSIYKEWMMDASRQEGDVKAVENSSGNGYYVVMFRDHSDNHYNVVSMRHILIKAAEDEEGIITEEALTAAHDAAAEIYAEWQAGEKTEESFAALADEKTEDTGSQGNGGLYEDIYMGEMVSEIESWLFDGRKAGDTEIIDVQSSGYSGTHVVYFVGEGDLYSNILARDELVNDGMAEWEETVLAAVEVTHGGTYSLIGK